MKEKIQLNFRFICRGVIIIFPIVLMLFMPMLFQEKIIISSIYPETGVATIPFNSFNGEAALSVKGTGFIRGDLIYIDNKPQLTTFGSSELLTCIVEWDLYKEPSNLKVTVIRKDNHKILLKSNTVLLEIVNN